MKHIIIKERDLTGARALRLLEEQAKHIARRSSVELDCSHVQSVDASGVAGLVRLYVRAQEVGSSLSLTGLSTGVAKELQRIGLSGVLRCKSAAPAPSPQLQTAWR